jgi:transposase InsO family protein
LPVPDRPWQDISMDFIFKLPKTKNGHDGIIVVCDRLSKMAHFIACEETITASETARQLLRHVIFKHGVPRSLVSDRDPRFISKFWKQLMRQLKTSVDLSTSHHPQTDGQTERTNQTLEQLLRCTLDGSDTWDDVLDLVEWAYNTSTSTDFPPQRHWTWHLLGTFLR